MVDVLSTAWSTLVLVREHLQIAASDTSKDEQLKSLINRATLALERYCGREQLKSKTYTEYHDGDGDDYILTQERPIISVTSLHDDPDRDFTATTLLTENEDFIVYSKEGMIKKFEDGVFNIGKQNIKLVYVAGYATIPDDAEMACTILVAFWYNKSGSEGHTSLSLGGLSKSYDPAAWPATVKALVEPFRKRPT